MPSMKCAHCIKVKQCKMVRGLVTWEYLCGSCRRELGYALPGGAESPVNGSDGPDAAYDTHEERELARDYEHGGEA